MTTQTNSRSRWFSQSPIRSLGSRFAIALLSLFAVGWSQSALATIGCEIQPSSGSQMTQTGAPGATLTFQFDIVDITGGCASTVNGTVIAGADSTGGAVASPLAWSGSAGSVISINVTLGPSNGGSAVYTIDCPSGDCSGGNSSIVITASTEANWTMTANTPTTATVLRGQNVPLGVRYLLNGASAGFAVDWTVDDITGSLNSPQTSTDSNGDSVNFFFSYTAGVYQVTAIGTCPLILMAATCPPPAVITTITVEQPALTILSPSGGTATVAKDVPVTLQVKFSGPTIPVADGTDIQWTVQSEPNTGTGVFTPQTGGPPSFAVTQTTNGFSSVDFTGSEPGTYVLQAAYCPDGCDATASFTITVPATSADVSITNSDSPDPVLAGGNITYTITVSNAGPDVATGLALTDTLPSSVTFVSLAAPGGWACSTPAVGASGPVNCNVASMAVGSAVFTLVGKVSPTVLQGSSIANTATISATTADTTPGNNSASTSTAVNTEPTTLGLGGGDGQTTPVNTPFPLPLTVVAGGPPSLSGLVAALAPTPGITINWVVISGSATPAAPSSVTNGSGVASMVINAGPLPGPIVIRASRADDPASLVTFNLISTLARTLTIASGNNQTGAPGNPLPQPLVVAAQDNGSPASGVSIDWTVTSGSATPGSPTTVTNGSGQSNNSLTMGLTPGTVTIKASRSDEPTVFVTFTANSASLASLPGLNPSQQAVAAALDEFCPQIATGSPPSTGGGLAAAAAPSAGQADLADRCVELFSAVGSDAGGVGDALGQMFADLALVQSESSLLAAQAQFDNIKVRIAALRSGTRGTSFGGLALMGEGGRLPVGAMFQNMLDGEEPADKEVGTDFSRWGFFAAGTLGRGKADAGVVSPSYDFDINGITVGADYRYSDKFIFGATLGYTSQGNDLRNDEGDLNTRGWSASGFATFYRADSWYSDAVLTYGHNSYEAERRVRYTLTLPGGATSTIDQVGKSNSGGDSITLAASFGRDFNKNGWGFGPYFRAIYTRLNFDAMTETMNAGAPGSGLALVFDTRDVTSVSSTLGGKLTYTHSAPWGVLIPHLQLEWQHEFKTDPSAVEARFLYDPTATPFMVNGDPIDSDFFRFGLGMSFVLARGRSGFFYYEKLISRDRVSQDSLALGIRLEF